MPYAAIETCLNGTDRGDVRDIAVSRNPSAHLWRKVLRAAARPWMWDRLAQRGLNSISIARIGRNLQHVGDGRAKVHFVEHHRAHLASAFFASPFDEAAVISVDGFGDFSSVMWGVGKGNRIDVRDCVRFPHSLGIFYTAFTQFLGFNNYGDEYKMMGLAAYGEPRFKDKVRSIVETRDGQCRLDLDCFTHHTSGVDMTWDGGQPVIGPIYSAKFRALFGTPREPRTEVLPIHADMAASVQAVLEDNYFALLNHVYRQTRTPRLCLAGGVALNCAANGKIFEKTPFTELYVQPAANDAGTSIGAALYVQHQVHKQPREYVMRHVYYGPSYSDQEIRAELERVGAIYRPESEDQMIDRTARAIADGGIIGWFQGRMEFGPRALGNRSILADPRRSEMKDILNARIKYREPFRPFCPSILAESIDDYFETSHPAPFMVTAYRIKPQQRSRIPAVTHNDGTGRLQTVEKDVNPRYWKLIRRFSEVAGVPVLLNTSFNENEPIVNSPREALDCFLRTQMDMLVLGSFTLTKSENSHLSSERKVKTAV